MTLPRTLAALVVAAALPLAGCGGSEDHTTSAATPASDGLVIDVTIADGTITPLGEKLDATTGEEITLKVTSDAEDELHLHAEPEETFPVTPGEHTFTFAVDVPGSVSLESHHVGGTIATIDVRP